MIERVSHGREEGGGGEIRFLSHSFAPRTFALIIFQRQEHVGRFLFFFFFFFSQVLIFKSDLFSDRISSNMQVIDREFVVMTSHDEFSPRRLMPKQIVFTTQWKP